MTNEQIVVKLRETEAELKNRAKNCATMAGETSYGRAAALVGTLVADIEASATPQVTPARTAAAYQQVEEQSDSDAKARSEAG